MVLQVLISTMHQKDYELISKMNISSDAIVINQTDEDSMQKFKNGDHLITWINSKERGLSRSRNMALECASGDICILADDDMEYLPDYKERILKQFELHPEADIIAFQVEGIERKYKSYYSNTRRVGFFRSMKISSVEIAFRLNKIREKRLSFNELFGAGSKYSHGEENIFLVDCLRSGLKILYVPVKIADLHMGESTWFSGFNEEYLFNQGACLTAMSNSMSLLLILLFAVKKYKLFSSNYSIVESIRYMLQGRKDYYQFRGEKGNEKCSIG